MMNKPKLTMFAGPNGSGKSSLTDVLREGNTLGEYINPDIIAAGLSGPYSARVKQAQALAEHKRLECIHQKRSFSFETVMSHPSKIETMRQAKAAGFTTTLFYVCLDHTLINIGRVSARVHKGGHDVPTDKIISRYFRSLKLLTGAVKQADNAFILDNSYYGQQAEVIAQIHKGQIVTLSDQVPGWVRHNLLDKLQHEPLVAQAQSATTCIDAKPGIRYRGKILSVSQDQAIQETARGVHVAHPLSNFPSGVNVGEHYLICHGKTGAIVKPDHSNTNSMKI